VRHSDARVAFGEIRQVIGCGVVSASAIPSPQEALAIYKILYAQWLDITDIASSWRHTCSAVNA
jgi:hypothetical protein